MLCLSRTPAVSSPSQGCAQRSVAIDGPLPLLQSTEGRTRSEAGRRQPNLERRCIFRSVYIVVAERGTNYAQSVITPFTFSTAGQSRTRTTPLTTVPLTPGSAWPWALGLGPGRARGLAHRTSEVALALALAVGRCTALRWAASWVCRHRAHSFHFTLHVPAELPCVKLATQCMVQTTKDNDQCRMHGKKIPYTRASSAVITCTPYPVTDGRGCRMTPG